MEITLEMFQSLCAASQVTPRIVDVVRGMRFKSSAADERLMSCYSSAWLPPLSQHLGVPVGVEQPQAGDSGFGRFALAPRRQHTLGVAF